MANLAEIHRRLRPLLTPVSPLYSYVMRLRAEMYGRGCLRSWTPPVPTVSVGNIRMGGSGKTPVTQWLAAWAGEAGLKPVILTRGYRARPPSLPFHVTPGSDPSQSGDEPLMLARSCPSARVIVDPERSRSACLAVKRLSPGLIILDDGFQHLKLGRHLDLVLLAPSDLDDDFGRVFPGGIWREGRTALVRASAFLIRLTPGSDPGVLLDRAERRLAPYGAPVFLFSLDPVRVSGPDGEERRPEKPYLLATGVADPAQVALSAAGFMGGPPVEILAFPDHHAFTAKDLAHIRAASRRWNARVLVTQKDAVKLTDAGGDDFLVLESKINFMRHERDEEDFPSWLTARIQNFKQEDKHIE